MFQDGIQHLDTVTRVEVIDENGRAWTTYNASNVLISMQDNDRTLKIFLKSNKPERKEIAGDPFPPINR